MRPLLIHIFTFPVTTNSFGIAPLAAAGVFAATSLYIISDVLAWVDTTFFIHCDGFLAYK